MILGFADRDTERLFRGEACAARWRAIERIALRKLDMLDAAVTVGDLRSPPGNRLELLKGNLAGLYSIRINDQWRICFGWSEGDAVHVRIIEYHD